MFITLEGGEGAGKSTQARLLADWLAVSGYPVLRTREPGGAPGAELLRGVLLSGEQDWSSPAEALLHFAARAEHVARTVCPALAAGMIVVCDRFSDSTMAYQGYGAGADRAFIGALARLIGLQPELTLVLQVSPATGQERLASRALAPDRYEREGAEFHARVAAGFDAIARDDPARCVRIPADGAVTEVAALVRGAVAARLA